MCERVNIELTGTKMFAFMITLNNIGHKILINAYFKKTIYRLLKPLSRAFERCIMCLF